MAKNGIVSLDRVLAILPDSMDRDARIIIETYLALRIHKGHTTREILTEHPVKASIEVHIYITGYFPEHVQHFEPGYVPSDDASFVERCLRSFYIALAVAGLRTAGDPFTSLAEYEADKRPH